jgi:hypothetical protein
VRKAALCRRCARIRKHDAPTRGSPAARQRAVQDSGSRRPVAGRSVCASGGLDVVRRPRNVRLPQRAARPRSRARAPPTASAVEPA